MAVVASTSAVIATISYVPPFSYYTSTDITYAGGPASTTTAAAQSSSTRKAASPTTSNPVNPTVPPRANDHDFIATYLGIHSLSNPSYRYAYFLWFLLIAFAVLYAIFHHLNLQGGYLGALWNKAMIRRKVLRAKRDQKATTSPGRKKRSHVLPSNAQVFSIALVGLVTALLCVIGADYIAANTGTWDLGTSFSKRYFQKRATTYATPLYNIDKEWWTSGARFGLIAFALFPLVVVLALKQPPAAILSIRQFTHLYADKLQLLHRWVGRFIWLLTAIHVALWSVRLFKDQRSATDTRSVWMVIWIYDKFQWAVVGFVAMTALIVLSTSWVRKRAYEFFYASHVVLTILTMLGSALHYPPLWYWIGIAAILWGIERIHRFIKFGWVNGWYGGMNRSIPFKAGPQYGPAPTYDYGMNPNDIRPQSDILEKSLPRDPFSETSLASGSASVSEFGSRLGSEYDVGTYDSKYSMDGDGYSDTYGNIPQLNGNQRNVAQVPRSRVTSQTHGNHALMPLDGPASGPGNVRTQSMVVPQPRSVTIPPGYGHAQILPSRTVRLTLRVPRPFVWTAGQHILLWVPEISRWQSHPFSILSTYEEDNEVEIVLLIKARKGFTAKLFNETQKRLTQIAGPQLEKQQHQSVNTLLTMEGQDLPPILYRVWVDGPHGSAPRANPGNHESVLLVCGGTGVSFGISMLNYLCRAMSNRDAGVKWHGFRGGRFLTQRVRFVWIVREFAELAWVSSMLKECLEMVPPDALQLDIFVTSQSGVTNRPPPLQSFYGTDDIALLPPRPQFAVGHGRRESSDSVSSEMSQDNSSELAYLDSSANNEYLENDDSSPTADVLDLTNYEDEDDVEESPAQQELSNKVQKEGKVRRARSRRANKRPTSGSTAQHGMRYPPSQPPSLLPYTEDHGDSHSYEDLQDTPRPQYAARQESRYDPPPPILMAPRPGHAHRPSTASSVGGVYSDPFGDGKGRYSPSPSMQTMDYDARSYAGGGGESPFPARQTLHSRASSMVFMEGAHEPRGANGVTGGGLWLEGTDYHSMNIIAEMARLGRPKLDVILQEEIDRARGTLGVGSK
ncbi:hypothetical protein QFC19_001619 [Naganishia cerealis]|uniref:Uncharacterized protein n=1 Tax=Naganishia cerealis TaxID=610337 RepID=A0ACC2WGG2_9TREE|nr:hypothetical protein QFC19_001619 [Naganishia cerealis]